MIKKKHLNNSLFIIIAFLIFSACEGPEKDKIKIKAIISDEILPDQISYNTEVAFVDSSFTKAILNAGRARIYNSNQETLLDSSVRVRFFDKNDKNKVSILTCDSARIDDVTKNMFAFGNVVVISKSQNMKLETSILEWKNELQRLYSTEYVEITTDREILRGFGFESDPDLNDYRIFKVSGTQNIGK